ncbi:MAG: cytochrome c biogenesis protein CcsA [Pseudomonadota bacterium]
MNLTLVNSTFLAYLITVILYLFYVLSKNNKVAFLAYVTFIHGFAFNVVAISKRWFDSGYPPFSNMYETMLFWAFSIALIHIIFEKIYNLKKIGIFSALLALSSIAYASFFADDKVMPLIPALQSNWLITHVVSYFIGYGALAISFVTSILFFLKVFKDIDFNNITYKLISFAFPFLTIGLVTGSIWAKEAWGDYWSWDPKEMWSLITWIVYLNYLHLPKTLPNVMKKFNIDNKYKLIIINVFATIGFIFVLFTYIGVNFLLSGLHSYA